MTFRVRALRLRSVTGAGTFGVDLSFSNGLNVISAPNTSGKSTSAQAILYALGLEAMLGPAREAPLPHAMTHSIEDSDGTEHTVLESQVLVEIADDSGRPLTVRRYVKHPSVDAKLVTVWEAAIDDIAAAGTVTRDYYVRDPGSATRESGFHFFLAERLGWELPEVPRFNGGSGPLYMETVAPLFYVEQKRGWSGIQSLTPTQFQIRDVKRRVLEFLLDLDVQESARRIAELRSIQRDISAKWGETIGEISGAAASLGAMVTRLPSRPASEWPLEVPPGIQVVDADEWVSLESSLETIRAELDRLESASVPTAGDSATAASLQLVEMESQLQQIRAASTAAASELALEEATADDALHRLASLEEDIRRHQDLQRLQRLGSEEAMVLAHDDCPTCHRPIAGVLLDPENSPPVLGVEESIRHLQGRKRLLIALAEDATRVVTARRAKMTALRATSTDLRGAVRALRETLVAPDSYPSIIVIERRLAARARIVLLEEFQSSWSARMEKFGEYAARWRMVRMSR